MVINMGKKMKNNFMLVAFGIALFALLTNLNFVFRFLKNAFALILPLVVGLIIAFVLSVPMKGFENLIIKLTSRFKKKPKEKVVQSIGFLLTVICVALVVFMAYTLVIPELVSSIMSIVTIVEDKMPEWISYLRNHDIDTKVITDLMSKLDFNKLLESLNGTASGLIGSVVNVSVSILSGVLNAFIAIIIAVYVLLSKSTLARQSKKLLYAYLSNSYADKICYVCKLIQETNRKFLSGQCVEAVILGSLIAIAYSIFGIPYAGLIGFLTTIFAFIPYVGAFASCVVGAVLIFIASPSKVILCVIIYLVVQFIETQFIYPHVVGTSVGLSPLMTLVAAMVGGNLFGVLGMIFFIPLTAVIYTLVKNDANKKLMMKKSSEGSKQTDEPLRQ